MLKKLSSLTLAIACLAALGWAQTADAQIAYEGFNYTLGHTVDGNTLNGGIGWAGAWTGTGGGNDGQVVAGLSNPPGLHPSMPSGNALIQDSGNQSQFDVAGRTLSATLNSGTVWTSFLINSSNSGSNSDSSRNANIRFTLGDDILNVGIAFQSQNNPTHYSLTEGLLGPGTKTLLDGTAANTGGTAGAAAAFTSGQTELFVEKFVFSDTAGQDKWELYFNPTSENDTAALVASRMGDFEIDGVSLIHNWHTSNGNQSLQTVWDEIRIGNTFASVAAVPEPASVAIWSLIGFGLAGFGVYRRRRAK